MQAADRGFVELDVSIGRAVVSAERDRCSVGAGGADELDLLSDVAAIDHLQSARKKLQRPIHHALATDGGRAQVVADEVATVASNLEPKNATALLSDPLGGVRRTHIDR